MNIETVNGVLLCPVCHHDMTHVDGVVAIPATGDGLVVHAEGEDDKAQVWSRPAHGHCCTRRHMFVLLGRCEMGCHFSISLAQHKGETQIGVDGHVAVEA